MFGFEKSDRANISDIELEGLQNLASDLLARNGRQLDEAVAAEALTEICHDYKNLSQESILDAVCETATGLHHLGCIDKRKMQQKTAFLCLEPIPVYDSKKCGLHRYKSEKPCNDSFQLEFSFAYSSSICDCR